jgi:ribosomal protein L3 glutamine methyltransferase
MFDQAAQEFTTLRDLLRFAVSRFNEAGLFFGHGSDNAHDEAAYLILHTLNLPLDTLEPYLDAKLLAEEKQDLLDLIARRVNERIPVAYLTNQAWQGDFDFYVDERVIVPRSFVHELLGEPLAPWIEHPELVHRALDLCTGSGCLAIQIAHHYPDAQIDAVDLSLDALEVAAINVEDYGLENRINLIHTDLFEGLEETYDLIVSNPPYVDAESVDTLPEEYLHEPELALGSGDDGLDATREILFAGGQTPQSQRRVAGGNRPQPRCARGRLSRAAVYLAGNQRRRWFCVSAYPRAAAGRRKLID